MLSLASSGYISKCVTGTCRNEILRRFLITSPRPRIFIGNLLRSSPPTNHLQFLQLVESQRWAVCTEICLVHSIVNHYQKSVYANRRIDTEQGEGERSGHTERKYAPLLPFIYICTILHLLLFRYIILSNWTGIYTEQLWEWHSQTARKSFLRTCRERGRLLRYWRAEGMLKVNCPSAQLYFSMHQYE